MKLLRTLAVASTSVVLLMGQAVAAFACAQHESARVMTGSSSIGNGQVPQPHRRR